MPSCQIDWLLLFHIIGPLRVLTHFLFGEVRHHVGDEEFERFAFHLEWQTEGRAMAVV
jgi:hypothetical protein